MWERRFIGKACEAKQKLQFFVKTKQTTTKKENFLPCLDEIYYEWMRSVLAFTIHNFAIFLRFRNEKNVTLFRKKADCKLCRSQRKGKRIGRFYTRKFEVENQMQFISKFSLNLMKLSIFLN